MWGEFVEIQEFTLVILLVIFHQKWHLRLKNENFEISWNSAYSKWGHFGLMKISFLADEWISITPLEFRKPFASCWEASNFIPPVIPPFSKPKNILKISVKCPWRASTNPSLETSLCTPMYFREIIPFTRRSDLFLAKNTLFWYSEFKISLFFRKFQVEIFNSIFHGSRQKNFFFNLKSR